MLYKTLSNFLCLKIVLQQYIVKGFETYKDIGASVNG